MRHLLTGDTKLFNVSTDYSEQENLALTLPKKVAEMDAVLTDYLKAIDGEDIQAVYQARLEELDKFEEQSKFNHERNMARLDPVSDADKIADSKKKLANDLKRFDNNRAEVARNRISTQW
jgi:DNA-binding protein Fis